MIKTLFCSLFAIVMFIAGAPGSVFIYDESADGDLSNNYLEPTLFTMGEGPSCLIGSISSGDRDLFTLHVPAGLQIDAITVLSYSTGASRPDNTSYLLSQPGEVLSSPPSNSDFYPDPIGYVGFGSWAVGMDVLPFVTFAPPYNDAAALGAGSYAFWINETTLASNYSLEFNVSAIPEPCSMLVILAALPVFILRRRRMTGVGRGSC